jgi:hypothetical protein
MLIGVMQALRVVLRVQCLWVLLAGCATAPPTAPPAPPPTPAEPSPAPAPARPTPAAPVGPLPVRGQATSINGPEGLTQLCESLRDEAALTFPGSAVDQARAFEAHAQRRQAVLAGHYVTDVPAAGFAFRNYELGSRRLVLDTERNLVLGDGAELFAPSREPAPGFALGPDLAERVLAQRSDSKVSLRLVFRPAASQLRKDTCVWLGGGRVVKLEIEIGAAALVAPDGTVLARADGGEYGDGSLATPVRAPRVTVAKVRTAEGKDLPAGLASAVAVLADKARPCYERVLVVRPGLRGTVVLGVAIGPGGRVEHPHIEMSSLADDAVSDCVAKAAAKATIAGAAAGLRLSVPLVFESADD